jgi:hypothetical protein
MRTLAAAAVALSIVVTPSLAASPAVEAAIKMLKSISADPQRMERFCRGMEVVENLQERVDEFEARVAAALDQLLGPEFKAAREAVAKIDAEADEAPDSKALAAALDELSEKCPD